MKIEQVLIHHLYNTKEVTLQGIGTFRLDPSVAVPPDGDKETAIPENAITFDYNPKATEDDALITAIVQHTKKIKPLASADLDSFLTLGRQFLNIGKPFVIEGLGTLDKTMKGEMIFIPGQFVTPKMIAPKAAREEPEEVAPSFHAYDNDPRSNNGRKVVAIVMVLLAIGIAAWVIYHFMFAKKSSSDNTVTKTEQSQVDTSSQKNNPGEQTDTTVKDTSAKITTAPPVNDNYTFRAVFKTTLNKDAGIKAVGKLKSWGHEVVMYTSDSVTFKLAELINLPLSDTTKVKDSLKKFYGSPVTIELK